MSWIPLHYKSQRTAKGGEAIKEVVVESESDRGPSVRGRLMAWVRLHFQSQPPADRWGPIEEVVVLYESGHHAPMRVTEELGSSRPRSVEELGRATVEGPALERSVVLGCFGDACRHNIRLRIPLSIGGVEGHLQRPRFGLSFASRVIEIQAGDQSWAVVPTRTRVELRRGGLGGRSVALRSLGRRLVSEEAAPEEVALALLLDTQGEMWSMTRIIFRFLFRWLKYGP